MCLKMILLEKLFYDKSLFLNIFYHLLYHKYDREQ